MTAFIGTVVFGTAARLSRWLTRLLRRRVPAGAPGSGPGDHPERGRWGRAPGPDDGGAGVREPRRPLPAPPGVAAHAEPVPEQHLDVGSTPSR